jgi:pimeloyl-ACP methyl ester carboxylesterase
VSEIALADGRRLAYAVMGAERGYPVVVLHGTPGSSRQLAGLHRSACDQGIFLVAPDRAGYGGSDHDPRRTIASSTRDVNELLNQLNLASCAIVGLSGGGPFALACGILHSERIRAVATVGGVAPPVARNLWGLPDRVPVQVARRSEACARWLLAGTMGVARASPERALLWVTRFLAGPDASLLRENTQLREGFLEDLHNPGPTTARAAARDYWLFAHPWDVDISDMSVPIHIWHGTADRVVPVSNARVIAEQCPAARLHLVRNGGHFLFRELNTILAELRTTR